MSSQDNAFIKKRGIKFNIPLDARTPSYSDAGDSAQKNILNVWNMNFWTEMFYEMSEAGFNVITIWNLHPFPSMIKTPGYENIALNDVMCTEIPLSPTLTGRNMSTPQSLANLKILKKISIEEKIDIPESRKDSQRPSNSSSSTVRPLRESAAMLVSRETGVSKASMRAA